MSNHQSQHKHRILALLHKQPSCAGCLSIWPQQSWLPEHSFCLGNHMHPCLAKTSVQTFPYFCQLSLFCFYGFLELTFILQNSTKLLGTYPPKGSFLTYHSEASLLLSKLPASVFSWQSFSIFMTRLFVPSLGSVSKRGRKF